MKQQITLAGSVDVSARKASGAVVQGISAGIQGGLGIVAGRLGVASESCEHRNRVHRLLSLVRGVFRYSHPLYAGQ